LNDDLQMALQYLENPKNKEEKFLNHCPPEMPSDPPMDSEDLPGGGDPDNKITTYNGKKVFWIPEPEGDDICVLANVYLLLLSRDVTQDMDDRRWAMTYVFETAGFKDWTQDLPQHPSALHIVQLVRQAMVSDKCANGRYTTGDDSAPHELLYSIDSWMSGKHPKLKCRWSLCSLCFTDAPGREGVTKLEVAMEKPSPLPI
jgi:hypothetical protein